MPVRIVEGQLPYTGGTGIEIDANKVISLLLREENNLILVNDDNEIYTDLQLASGLTPQSDFPVGVTTGKVLEGDGRPQSGLMLNRKTTSGDYARWIYCADGEIYFDGGNGVWRKVYYSSEVDALLQQLRNYIDLNFQPKLTAGAGITIDANNVISAQGAGTGDVSGPNSSTNEDIVLFDGTTGKAIKDSGVKLSSLQEKLTAGTNIQINGNTINATDTTYTAGTNIQISAQNVISATGGSDIVYATQAEYNALLPGALTDGKHYFIYSTSGGGGWQPGANTMLYLPLDGDVVDYSTYNRSFTVYGSTASVGTPVFDTLTSGKKVANFITPSGDTGTNTNWFAFTTNVTDIPHSGNMTVSFWMNWSGTTNYYEGMVDFRNSENGTDNYCWMTGLSNSDKFLFHGVSAYVTTFTPTVGTWYNMICVVDGGNYSIYQNGNTTPIKTGSYTFNSASTKLCLGGFYTDFTATKRTEGFNGKIADIIIEDKAWTAQEVADYYDQTKGDYGIS